MALISNAALAAQIQGILDQFETVQDEFQDWITGEVNGGDASDGRYPLTARDGTIRMTLSPAQLEDDVTGAVASAEAAQTAAEAAETNAAASAATAASETTDAETARTGSELAQSLAEAARDAAESHKAIAIAQAAAAVVSASDAAASAVVALAAEAGAVAAAGLVADPGFDAVMTWNDTTNVAEWVVPTAIGSIAETQITDGSLLARLADNETITGNWTFTGQSVFSRTGSQIRIVDTDGTDPNDYWLLDANSDNFNFYLWDDSAAAFLLPLRFQPGGLSVDLRDGFKLLAYDASNTDYIQINDTGTYAFIETNTNDIYLRPQGANAVILGASQMRLLSGRTFRIDDATNADNLTIAETGSQINFTANNNPMYFYPSGIGSAIFGLTSSQVQVRGGNALVVSDSANTDYLAMFHDGSSFYFNFTNTAYAYFNQHIRLRTGADLIINTADDLDDSFTIGGASAAGANSFFTVTGDLQVTLGVDGGSGVFDQLTGGYHRVRSPDNTNYTQFNVTDTGIATLHGVAVTNYDFSNIGNVRIRDGAGLYIYESADVDNVRFYHDGTDMYETHTGTRWRYLSGPTSGVIMLGGQNFRMYDSTNADYFNLQHDGTDFNTTFFGTTDWNITVTNMRLNATLYNVGIIDVTGQQNIRSAGSHLSFYETDGTDPADRYLQEINGNNWNYYFYDDSAATWHLLLRLTQGPSQKVYLAGETTRYFEAVDGSYGSVQVEGGGPSGTWAGYSIGGRHVFMDNGGTNCGIYNDNDNEWMFYAADNGAVNMYYNGVVTLYTTLASNGGAYANNTLTGGGNERVLTASDKRTTGSFTGTLTGMSAATTGTYNYRIEGNQVTIYRATKLTGTSTASTMTMTGLPAAIQPAIASEIQCGPFWDLGGGNSAGVAKFAAASGTITFELQKVSATYVRTNQAFQNTLEKGTGAAFAVTYSLG